MACEGLRSVLTCDQAAVCRFLIGGRDATFARAFDDVWRLTEAEVICTPVRDPTPMPSLSVGFGAVRRECLDHLLIVGRQRLARVVRRHVEHYNQCRPRRGLAHATPVPPVVADPMPVAAAGQLRRRDVLGGLIHRYEYAA